MYMNAAKHAVATVKGTAFYFRGQQVRIESDMVVTPNGASVLCRRWNADTQTVEGFHAYVLVEDLEFADAPKVERCPRCNAPETRHNDTCPLILADLKSIADNPHFTKMYRTWARRELRSLMAAKRRQAVSL